MNRINYIRNEEKKYHDFCYQNYKLFEEGSWLYKPVKTIIDILPLFRSSDNLTVLDLGCGVGRNSIPIAQTIQNRKGHIICVDLLDSALNKLKEYRKLYNVEEVIRTVKADIADYVIKPNTIDLIIAVSALEHVKSEDVFDSVIKKMTKGTKNNGVNCLIVNSEIQEINLETNSKLDALMELNLSTESMLNKLNSNYVGWEIIKIKVKPQEYNIIRNEKPVLLKTNAITYVVRKFDALTE